MANVTVIIPSLNGYYLLAECIPALLHQTYKDFQVIVIDNGSTDGTVPRLKDEYPQVKIIENSVNTGFATAVNQGILNSDSPFVVTLNNDVVVDADWLECLMDAIERDPQIGMCASKLVFWDEPSIINSSGICVDRAGIVWDRDGGLLDSPLTVSKLDVFGPCAGAALYKREMLDKIGIFDEAYFAYFEDVDLAWRAQAAGWRCHYIHTARGRHHHSSTSVKGSRFKNYQLGKNKVRLILKNYPFKLLWWYIPLVIIYDIFGILYQLAVYKNIDTLRGRWAGWRCAAKAIKARPIYPKRYDVLFLSHVSWPWSVRKRFRYLINSST
jgi:GT2 family glycosyltransferase